MKKKRSINRLMIVLPIFLFLIAVLEGYFYYAQYQESPFFYGLLILQNALKAFQFKSDISLHNVIASISADMNTFQLALSYLYAIIVFVAPIYTLSIFCAVANSLLNFTTRLFNKYRKKPHCTLIFGYNENVKIVLSQIKQRPVLVIARTDFSQEEKRELLKKGITCHTYDCLSMDRMQQSKVLCDLQVSDITSIILLEDSSLTNFSLFHMLCEHSEKFQKNPKCYCNCEDDDVRVLTEDFYDSTFAAVDAKTPANNLDLEVFSLPELQVRQMFINRDLHSCYKDAEVPPAEQHVHLLIVGFGQMGQHVLLQAMNLGVTHSQNRILIDVVDHQMDRKRKIFANHFHSKYVEINENNFCIKPPAADGQLQIRFHSMDVTYQEFRHLLADMSTPPFTYATICLQDTGLGIHCAMELQRFLARDGDKTPNHIPIYLRMDSDIQMTRYLNGNNSALANFYAMPNKSAILSDSALFCADVDKQVKEFHSIYTRVSLLCGTQQTTSNTPSQDSWRTLRLFQRDSNRALYLHSKQKKDLLDAVNRSALFGTEQSLLRSATERDGNQFFFDGTEEELARFIHESPDIRELASTEHRRWCYFMASRGWTWGEKKNMLTRENPYLSNWETLYATHPDMCKYDLMPFLIDPASNKKVFES